MWEKIFLILKWVGGPAFLSLLYWAIKKFISWKWSLGISVNSKNLKIIEAHGGMGGNRPLELYMPIGFTNRTSSKFDVTFSDFNFNSEKNIDGLIFGIKRGIFKEPNLRKSPIINLSIEPGNESHYLCIKISSVKNYNWNEFFEYIKEYENIRMILSFNYSIATYFKQEPFKKKIKNLLNGVINSIKDFYKRKI